MDREVIDWEWGALYEDINGAPVLRTSEAAGLRYLKRVDKLSDEQVVARWVKIPYDQYFSRGIPLSAPAAVSSDVADTLVQADW